MSALLYRGFNSEGCRLSGSKGFASKEQMEEYLHKRGIEGYEIFESKTVYKHGVYSLVSPKELSIFCKQMSVMFFSHLTLMEGIVVLTEQTENKQLKLALEEVHGFMERGLSFAEAMRMYEHIFSTYLLNMIVIGETSGTLDTTFHWMSTYFEKEDKIRKRIKSAITYPAILGGLMTAIIVLLIVKILPMFSDILESMGAQMPSATKLILNGSLFLVSYAPFIILAIAVIVIAILLYIRTDKGSFQFDKAKFSIPASRYINSRIVTSRFSRSLAILLKSGVQLLIALEDISVLMENRYIEKRLMAAVEEVKDGRELSGVLQEIGVFPVLFLKMFAIGEKTGNLDEMLDKSASVFDDEVDDSIERFTAMLEPILIIILSVIIGIILLSVMLPMITVMNAIG